MGPPHRSFHENNAQLQRTRDSYEAAAPSLLVSRSSGGNDGKLTENWPPYVMPMAPPYGDFNRHYCAPPFGMLYPEAIKRDETQKLTPLELRRKRNRESMARARRREREELHQMRQVLQELEQQYRRLSEEQHQKMVCIQKDTSGSIPTLRSEFHMLSKLSLILKEENFRLQEAIGDCENAVRRISRVVLSHSPSPNATMGDEELQAQFNYTHISENQANELIRQWYVQHRSFQQTVQQQPAQASAQSLFGWTGRQHLISESCVFVVFEKLFDAVPSVDAMHKTWEIYGQRKHNQNAYRPVVRMERLQTLNDNAYVMLRDMRHPTDPTKTFRTIYLRFRLVTEDGGFVVGRACMNPPVGSTKRQMDEELGGFIYADVFLWVELNDVQHTNGQTNCMKATFNVLSDYHIQQDPFMRLLNLFVTAHEWENMTIRPSNPLLQSE